MATDGNWIARGPVKARRIEAYAAQIASPDEHVGGASAAATAAAIAASTAELVVFLSVRGNRSAAPDSTQSALDELQTARAALLEAADRDEQVLETLMNAYKRKGDNLQELLSEAAETTLRIAELAGRVTKIAAAEVGHASRFTASDLGAAAALASGAVTAALLTCRINIAMLQRSDEDSKRKADTLDQRAMEIERSSAQATEIALRLTAERIGQSGSKAS
ncbi:MAG: cyclodeaminase/cyclohydrolase family protein [Thermomicrobiales bacterium]